MAGDAKGAAGAGPGLAAAGKTWQLSMLPGMAPLPRGTADLIVVVTGATGFIGGHIIKLLLEHTDYAVRGTVRSTQGTSCDHLKSLQKQWPNRLTIVDGCDLVKVGTFDGAIKGAHFVIHTASGVAFTAPDKKRDIIDPAILGTTSVLNACARSGGTVRRMVMTSSSAAVVSDDSHGKTLSEKDWNTTASETHDHYGYSKVESERLCWKYVAELPADQRFDMVVINPTLVLGPLLSTALNNQGLILITRMLNRKFPAMPRFKYGVVDVRDVSRAHVAALTSNVAAGQRYIISNQMKWLSEVSASLRTQFPAYNAPTGTLPDWVMWTLVSLGLEKQIDADGLRVRLGRSVEYDNAKLKRDLAPEGLDRLIPVDECLRDTAQSLIAAKMVSPGASMGTKILYATGAVVAAAAAAAAAWYYWPSRSSSSGGSGAATE